MAGTGDPEDDEGAQTNAEAPQSDAESPSLGRAQSRPASTTQTRPYETIESSSVAFRLLADATVVLHLVFVAFVVCGGLLVLHWRRVAWVHLPAAAWGAWIEFAGWICPLTPLENWLRAQGGAATYTTSFVERYLLRVLYPESLSRDIQLGLGVLVILVNGIVYAVVVRSRKERVTTR